MIRPGSRPRLAPKARLKADRKTGRTLLLYPEAGLELNRSGTAILELCTGELEVREIVDCLVERHSQTERNVVEREVFAFLEAMVERCLVEAES